MNKENITNYNITVKKFIKINISEEKMIMYRLFYAILVIVWILDVINVPALAFLDTTVPINGLGWFLIWVCIPSYETVSAKSEKKNK